MKNYRLLPVGVALLLCTVGCASAYNLNVTASPDGAVISQNGQVLGEAPVTVAYHADPNYMTGNCLRAMGVTATWTSGASIKCYTYSNRR